MLEHHNILGVNLGKPHERNVIQLYLENTQVIARHVENTQVIDGLFTKYWDAHPRHQPWDDSDWSAESGHSSHDNCASLFFVVVCLPVGKSPQKNPIGSDPMKPP